jgi:Domain of unknown function (DUF4131)
LLAGITWAWGQAGARLEHDLPTCLEGRDLMLRGYVASLADTGAGPPAEAGRRFDLDVFDRFPALPARVRLCWYDSAQRPGPGELWQLTVRLKRRNGFANPGGFDYEAHLFKQAIGATGYVREDARNRRLDGPSYRYSIVRLRAWVSRRIAEAVPDEPMLGILQGLAVAVQTSTHTLVYDAGLAFQTGRDAGELAVLPWLRHRGIRALDALVWGFPRAEIQQRWRAAGAQTYTTADGGALTVALADSQPLEVREHRRTRRRYWQR